MGAGTLLLCGAALCLLARPKRGARPAVPASEPEGKTPVEILLERYVADAPTPGHFYQVQPTDNPLGVAAAALGLDAPASAVVDYIHCWASGPNFNLPMYATPSTSKAFPRRLLVPGKHIGVRVAFLPRNDDALGALLENRWPRPAVHPRTGAPAGVGRSYGLLWLPPVDEDFSCSPFAWDDATSTIDPPPSLLAALKGPDPRCE